MPELSKEVIFRLVDELVEASSRSGAALRSAGEAWLNPQPLPPGGGDSPQPEAWRAAAVARQIISTATLTQATALDAIAGQRIAKGMLEAFVNDFCGATQSRSMHLPPPWPRSGVRPNAIGLIAAASQFHVAAKTLDGATGEALLEASERLLTVGLQRLSGC